MCDKPRQFHCFILILFMLAELMAVCWKLMRREIREIVVSIFDAIMNFLTFYFITANSACTNTDNIDFITVRDCIEGWTDFGEYFSNYNTYVYCWDIWVRLQHFGWCFCHCWVLNMLFFLCRFNNCILIGEASFLHRCVRSTTICTFGFIFWFGALFYCVCRPEHCRQRCSFLRSMAECPYFWNWKHCLTCGGSLLGSHL